MKKTYMKPEVNEIEVAANQAVAACSLMYKYWQNHDNRNPNGYPSEQAAKDAQPDWASHTAYKLCPVYYYEYEYKTDANNTSKGYGYWEDWDKNGKWSEGDIVQNQSGNRPDLSVNWQGVVINS